LQVIERNGGKVNGEMVTIKSQSPVPVRYERSFEGLYPVDKIGVNWSDDKTEAGFEFTGTGFAWQGETGAWGNESDYVLNTELYIDDKLVESPKLPVSYTTRRYELCWKYDLPKGKHKVKLKILNATNEFTVHARDVIIYTDKPVDGIKANVSK